MKLLLQRLVFVCGLVPVLASANWAMLTPSDLSRTIPGSSATRAGESRRSKRPRPVKDSASRESELLEMVRRAQETADEAREEARSARTDYEALAAQMKELTLAVNRGGNPMPADSGKEPAQQAEGRSINERLSRTEEQVEIHSAQIKEHAQTKVESDSKFNVKLSGMILFNTFYNSDGIPRTEPLFALPRLAGAGGGTYGSTLRQTRLGLAVSGPRLAGARLSADIDFDFYGGTVAQYEGDVLGAMRIRTASARLDWERTSITVGQEAPVVSPRNPTSLAAVWFPALSGAGNLWQWRPRASVEHRFRVGDSSQIIAEGSFVPPFGESYSGNSLRGTPSYETRVAWRHALDTEKSIEIGVGGHYGRRDLLNQRKLNDFIVSSDWLIPIGERLELSGEFYHGRAVGLGEQSGSRIDRLYAFTGSIESAQTLVRGIRSTGGWAQLTAVARAGLEFNFAYGQEDPNNADLRFGLVNGTTRLKNQVGSANFIYQFRPTFMVSLEYRRLWTNYASSQNKNNHYSVSVAYVF
ncbi:MAG: hypothetical protein ABI882_02115 [Acidobacteriota bacterium]